VESTVEPDRPQMTTWCMCFARWITKATDMGSEYAILLAFPQQSGYTNMPQCYVTRTLPALFFFMEISFLIYTFLIYVHLVRSTTRA
jgi:hypothetical protein